MQYPDHPEGMRHSMASPPHDPHSPGSDDDLWETGPVYMASNRPLARLVARPVREFLRVEAAGSLLLLLAAAVALVWANSPWASSYDSLWHTHLVLDVGPLHLDESLQHWVNDALMVVFFFVVGLEIKYELVNGDLRDPKTAALPIIAAVGGMVVPAGLYLALNPPGSDGSAGWGIPMATDIAFAVGVLGILGRRIPSAARLFLLTLAIVDDIGAILVIAVFYTSDLSLGWLALAVGLLGVMAVAKSLKIWTVVFYAVARRRRCGSPCSSRACTRRWPASRSACSRPRGRCSTRRSPAATPPTRCATATSTPTSSRRLRFLMKESVSVVERLQSTLHPVSAYVVLPVFALANAGVELGAIGKVFTEPVGLGIILGLVLGKPVGIFLASFAAVRLGLGRLPDGTSWPMVLGLGAVGGIGFTVSIFIAGLSFPGADLLTEEAKIAILLASLLAAVVGVAVLLAATKQVPEDAADD